MSSSSRSSDSAAGDGSPDVVLGVFALVLAIIFALLLVLAAVQLLRIFWYRHSKGSFQFLFLVLCILWMTMRLVLIVAAMALGADVHVPLPLSLLFLYLPLNLEFATYTLLVVFYCQVIYRTQWEDYYKKRFFGIWVVGNVLFLLSNVTWIILAGLGIVTLENNTAIFIRFFVPGVAFLVLSILLATFGILLQRTLRNPVALVPFKANGSSVMGITLITLLLMLVFVGRTIYNFVIAFETLLYQFFPGEVPIYRFLSVLLSEQLPTFAILMFFRHVPRKRSLERRRLPPALYNSINQSYGAADSGPLPTGQGTSSTSNMSNGGFLFANPQRYDSDDEAEVGNNVVHQSSSGKGPGPSLLGASGTHTSSYGRQVAEDAFRSIFAGHRSDQTNPLPEVASPSGSYRKLGKSHSSGRSSQGSRSQMNKFVTDEESDDATDDVIDAEVIRTP